MSVVAFADGSNTTTQGTRFFFSGDGRLQLAHGHWKTQLDVRYRGADGTYDRQALAVLRHFFRSRLEGEEGDISLRLVELIDFVEDRHPPRRLTLYSGFRSPELNTRLPGTARASLHTQGLAADVSVEGADHRRLWRQLRELRTGGVGFYPEGYLHLDTGEPRFWEASTSRTSENLSGGNARSFARTDFDRYTSLDGAVVSLHSVTVFPLGIAAEASLLGENGAETTLQLAGVAGAKAKDGCIVFDDPLAEPRLSVRRGPDPSAVPKHERGRIHLRTCPPRLERTPREILSNLLEWVR